MIILEIQRHAQPYIIMVLFICNYVFDAEKLERALSSFIDIIFSIRWIQFLP